MPHRSSATKQANNENINKYIYRYIISIDMHEQKASFSYPLTFDEAFEFAKEIFRHEMTK